MGQRKSFDHTVAAHMWRLARQSRQGRAQGFLRFWLVWEAIMHLFFPVQAIPHAPNALIVLHLMRHRGRPLVLADGTTVRRGERVGEVHIQSRVSARLMQQGNLWQLVVALHDDFQALAEWMASDPALADVRAIWGTTILYRAAPRFGFMVRARPPTFLRWLERFFLQGLLVIYSQDGIHRLKHGKIHRHYAQEVWMSRAQLLQRYLPTYGEQSQTCCGPGACATR